MGTSLDDVAKDSDEGLGSIPRTRNSTLGWNLCTKVADWLKGETLKVNFLQTNFTS